MGSLSEVMTVVLVSVLALTFHLTHAQAQEVQWPRHMAAMEGDDVTIRCNPAASTSNPTGEWELTLYSNLIQRIDIFDSETDMLLEGYEMSTSDPYDLTVKDVNEDNVGYYFCKLPQDSASDGMGSITLVRDFICDVLSDTEEIEKDDNVTLTCSVDVYGMANLNPTLDWSKETDLIEDQGDLIVGEGNPSQYNWHTLTRVYSTPAKTTDDNVPHNCWLYWDSGEEDSRVEYNRTCTETFRVRHTPTDIRVEYNDRGYTSGSMLEVHRGESLKCTVSAYPNAGMEWKRISGPGPNDPEVDESTNTLLLEITDEYDGGDNEYHCVATQTGNDIRDTMEVTFKLVEGSIPDSASSLYQTVLTIFAATIISAIGTC